MVDFGAFQDSRCPRKVFVRTSDKPDQIWINLGFGEILNLDPSKSRLFRLFGEPQLVQGCQNCEQTQSLPRMLKHTLNTGMVGLELGQMTERHAST